jgi:hypothetical protein
MAEKPPKAGKEGAAEKGARWYRNFNAVGAVALFGVGVVVPPIAPAMNVLAAINVVQAAGGEAVRRHTRKKRKK